MKLTEEKMDLLLVPQGYYLAHCISGDYLLEVGLAARINEAYDMESKLEDFYPYVETDEYLGNALLIDNVFNLITKRDRYSTANYFTLKAALLDVKKDMEQLMVTKLAIPKLGCGRDRLDWVVVGAIIKDIFNDTDVEILVCVM